jgi:hypothetical protein
MMALAVLDGGAMMLGFARVEAINDQRLHAAAEDLAQLGVERPHGHWDLRHMSIINACVSGS